MLWKRQPARAALGIECGDHGYKAVAIDLDERGYRVSRILSIGADEAATIDRFLPSTRMNAAVSVPSMEVDVRLIHAPELAERDLRGMAGYELSTQIQTPLEELCYDFTYSNAPSTNGRTRRPVIAFVCRKSTAERLLGAIQSKRVEVKALDVAWMALMNLYHDRIADFERGAFIGLDAGGAGANIIVSRNGEPLFARYVPIQAENGIMELQSRSNLLDELAAEIRRTLQYCRNQFQLNLEEVKRILLSGGRTGETAFEERLSRAAGLNCQRTPLFDADRMTQDAVKPTAEEAPRYAIALGLALRAAKEAA
ncbi:MAG: hypothetical protein GC154_05645 [bacterium]|nr:hypothetical protein [bacterium]